jgi:flagellar biosynthetic protein FliR
MAEILVTDFLTGIMIFLRISAMFVTAPIYNSENIPVLVRLALALIITYIAFFSVDKVLIGQDDSYIILVLYGIKEIFTGVIMGMTLNIVFHGVSFAGLLFGRDMGLAMTQMFDPTSNTQGNIISTILALTIIVVFILINGHHFVVQAVTYSFKIIPIGEFKMTESAYDLLIKYSASIFILAVKIASPIIVAFFLVHRGIGIIDRVSASFPLFFFFLALKLGRG